MYLVSICLDVSVFMVSLCVSGVCLSWFLHIYGLFLDMFPESNCPGFSVFLVCLYDSGV